MAKHESDRNLVALHIAPTPFFSDRGCHMRIRGIISGLQKLSLSCVLCTYHLGRDIEGIETVRTAVIPGYTKLETGPSGYKYLADVLLFFKTCSLICERKPDLIHGHLHEGALLGWAARLCFFWRRIPLVFDVQGSLVGELEEHGYFRKSRLLKSLFWSIEYLITRMPDYFVCSSQNSVNILKDVFHVDPRRIELVNDGTDVYPVHEGGVSRSGLGIPEDKALVIYTGALLEYKGLNDLFELILETRRRQLDCHFLVVGYPEQVMLDFRREHQLEAICTVVGRVPYERLGDYLQLADMAVDPKFSDSGEASGKLLNYMGAGLPALCFDTPSNRHILGDAGYYAQPRSVAGLVDHIASIVSQPQAGRARGESGRHRVEAQFSWDAGAKRLQAVYHACLGA